MNNNNMLFCQEYVKNGSNGLKAYTKIYKCKNESTAKVNASKLLTKPNIREYIKKLQSKTESKMILTTIEKREFLRKIVSGEVKDSWFNIKGEEIEKEPSVSDKMKAIDIDNKMSGDYIERVMNLEPPKIVDDV